MPTLSSSYLPERSERLTQMLHLFWLIGRQILWRVLMLIAISFIVFVILRAIPVDPVKMLLPPGANTADIANLTRNLGLDRPLFVQFIIWLKSALTLDFGASIQTAQPVTEMLAQSLPITLQLLFFALAIGIIMGLASGLLTFCVRGSLLESAFMFLNGTLIAIPDYLWAILLIVLFGVVLQWFPFIGAVGSDVQIEPISGFPILDALLRGNWSGFFSAVDHMILPSTALGICLATPIARIMYTSLVETYREEYITAARLRGIGEYHLLFGHALRNAALPTVSLIGIQGSVIIGSTLLVESIFGLPGIGNLMLTAMGGFDIQVIQAVALCYAISVQLINLMTDLLFYHLNPRLRTPS